MVYNFKVLFGILCGACIIGLILLQAEIFEEKLRLETFEDYCFYGTESVVPRNYSEEAIKKDILSKLPKNLRSEVQKSLRKTEILLKNERKRIIGETACPFQVEVRHLVMQFNLL